MSYIYFFAVFELSRCERPIFMWVLSCVFDKLLAKLCTFMEEGTQHFTPSELAERKCLLLPWNRHVFSPVLSSSFQLTFTWLILSFLLSCRSTSHSFFLLGPHLSSHLHLCRNPSFSCHSLLSSALSFFLSLSLSDSLLSGQTCLGHW